MLEHHNILGTVTNIYGQSRMSMSFYGIYQKTHTIITWFPYGGLDRIFVP